MSAKKAAYEALLARLPSSAQAAMRHKADPLSPPAAEEPLGDEQVAYAALLDRLPASARDAMRAAKTGDPPAPPAPPAAAARYCLVESPDGEWARLRTFKTAEAAARRLGELEGRDVVVWAFYGVPLQFTRGPQRHVLLPDGSAVSVPLFAGGPVEVVDAGTLGDLAFEEAGYVGPPELAVAPPADAGVTAAVDDD